MSKTTKTTVCLGYVGPGDVRQEFMDSILGTLLEHQSKGRHLVRVSVSIQSGPRIAEGRTQVVREFLETGAEWLWMVDTDMVFESTALDELLAVADPKDAPIVGGLCFAGRGGRQMFPTIYEIKTDDLGRVIPDIVHDYPRDSLCQVGATGAAFLLVHKSVFKRMRREFGRLPNGQPSAYPWFVEASNGGVPYGEDISFCLRANACGYPIYVDTSIKIGHIKHHELTEAAYLSNQAMPVEAPTMDRPPLVLP